MTRMLSMAAGALLLAALLPATGASAQTVSEQLSPTLANIKKSKVVRLGYRVVRRYEKVREEWQLGAIVVALDHTPIGDFVELEGDDAPGAAARLGFDVRAAERRSYLRLYEDWRRDHPELPADMMFL